MIQQLLLRKMRTEAAADEAVLDHLLLLLLKLMCRRIEKRLHSC
jgi:hypothetical protein